MSDNKLKLNPNKTEFIVFGAKDRDKWLSDTFPVNILGHCLSPTAIKVLLELELECRSEFGCSV